MALGALVLALPVLGTLIALLLGPNAFWFTYQLGAAIFACGVLIYEFMAGSSYDGIFDRLIHYAAIYVGALVWPLMLTAILVTMYRDRRSPGTAAGSHRNR